MIPSSFPTRLRSLADPSSDSIPRLDKATCRIQKGVEKDGLDGLNESRLTRLVNCGRGEVGSLAENIVSIAAISGTVEVAACYVCVCALCDPGSRIILR